MIHWVKCTRKIDQQPIYINVGTATALRWNEQESFTVVSWASDKEATVRVLERPEDIIKRLKQP